MGVDGTLVPVGNHRDRKGAVLDAAPAATAATSQVLVDRHGRIGGVSRHGPGRRHDVFGCTQVRLAMLLDSCGVMIGARGYPGLGMVSQAKKPAGGERPDEVRKSNPRIRKARVVVERETAHLKHWRILSTRYRSDLSRFDTKAQVVAGRRLHERLSGQRLSFTQMRTTGLAT